MKNLYLIIIIITSNIFIKSNAQSLVEKKIYYIDDVIQNSSIKYYYEKNNSIILSLNRVPEIYVLDKLKLNITKIVTKGKGPGEVEEVTSVEYNEYDNKLVIFDRINYKYVTAIIDLKNGQVVDIEDQIISKKDYFYYITSMIGYNNDDYLILGDLRDEYYKLEKGMLYNNLFYVENFISEKPQIMDSVGVFDPSMLQYIEKKYTVVSSVSSPKKLLKLGKNKYAHINQKTKDLYIFDLDIIDGKMYIANRKNIVIKNFNELKKETYEESITNDRESQNDISYITNMFGGKKYNYVLIVVNGKYRIIKYDKNFEEIQRFDIEMEQMFICDIIDDGKKTTIKKIQIKDDGIIYYEYEY